MWLAVGALHGGHPEAGAVRSEPDAWAVHIRAEPTDVSYTTGGNTRVLMIPTAGDKQVPPDTGAAMARSAGLLGSWKREPDKHGSEHGWRELKVCDASCAAGWGLEIPDETACLTP